MKFSHKTFFFLLVLGFFLAGVAFIFSFKNTQIEIAMNNKKEKELEMKKLPVEIKRKIEKDIPFTKTVRIPILVYHYVEIVTDKKDKERKSLSTPPLVLEKQIETLKNAGYTFLTASDIGELLDGKRKFSQKEIVLSFDDGYRDFYTDVFPILKKEQVKAVAYIVPGFLNKTNYLFEWQLLEIAKDNLIEIGAHTMHHVYLKGEQQIIAKKEILESKTILENTIHKPVVSFAYPYGAFDEQAVDIVKQAGFTTAVSTIGGNDINQLNRYFLYRIHPGYASGNGLISLIEKTFPTKY